MRTPRRSECAVLPLVLKGKWYDMIASGEKREEYRDATPYWRKRIMKWLYDPREKHIVAFSRGYRKPDMFFWACTSWNTYIGGGRAQWGEPEAEHYKIDLLERVELEEETTNGKV